MPVLGDLLEQAVFLTAIPAVVGVLVTSALLVISGDWRLNLLALAAQYLFVALLMTQIIRIEMAAVKALIGWVICSVFYLTEQQTRASERSAESEEGLSLQAWFSARVEGWRHEGISAKAAFNLVATMVVGVAVYASSSALGLPQLSSGLTLACYWLAGLGILLVGLNLDPLRVGIGLLTFLSGFDLFYVALEPSLVVAGLFGSISFAIALGTAFLRATQVGTSDGVGTQ
ncbi:MAG: hypothetical protein PVJ55_11005 [Anaerolineae bacterium]|jgi:hypothetical protein